MILFDVERAAPLYVLQAHQWSIAGVAMSPDGSRALSGSIDGDLKLWNVETGEMLRDWEMRHPGRIESIMRAMTEVRASHLLDRKLFDFESL